MKSEDADAIARFIQQGGQVQKVTAAMPASEGEILAYLAECGLTVKFFPGDRKPYSCLGRRYSIDGLVRLANIRRAAQHVPPLMLGRHTSAASGSIPERRIQSGLSIVRPGNRRRVNGRTEAARALMFCPEHCPEQRIIMTPSFVSPSR